ncbi:P-type E1-E2 ATPase [Methylobacterium sp. PvP062]|jgi:P-type E1-E2 ATPase|nr:hypothetical protein A3862_06880 [Methylobacterium sp. XJLW]KIU28369.1 hypothetical protein SR39_26200 [Methylobacterium radiotolerans]MBP2498023.1 P-type E1-E2 ATPase [Methylobacterium sp. PvP105]MBP2502106.1 P-type E1-E2 ATPase [Methylobacterium sp. PvP109]PVY88472.1 P-type E1-E2 ATPase [Methylobacterium organophilum]GJE48259.1 Potassium-transporting ATPase ATP-binding subunit [Methylobacterium tardum]
MEITTVGIHLAKSIFQVHAVDAADSVAAACAGAIMLTGDNARTAQAVASALGIGARAELLPEDELRIVRELQGAGAVVAKVGDDINDAPALAAADVGIAWVAARTSRRRPPMPRSCTDGPRTWPAWSRSPVRRSATSGRISPSA